MQSDRHSCKTVFPEYDLRLTDPVAQSEFEYTQSVAADAGLPKGGPAAPEWESRVFAVLRRC